MINNYITKSFKYVTFLDANKKPLNGIESKPIIYSDRINHELASMLFAKNHDETELAITQMQYEDLTDEEVSTLANVGFFQISSDEALDKYEFYSILNSIEVTAILVPQAPEDATTSCHYLYFSNNKKFMLDDSGTLIDFSKLTGANANRLLLVTKSDAPVKDLSQEIHNSMIRPHSHIEDYILFENNLSEFMALSVIDFDNMFDRQSKIKLASILVPFDSVGDTNYSLGILDRMGEKYIYSLNQESKIIK